MTGPNVTGPNEIWTAGDETVPTRGLAARPVRCFWCAELHSADHPLSVCHGCAARYATMRSLQMSGSYPLSAAGIDEALKKTSPGNYALGYLDEGSFEVFYVGSSGSDVRRRLHEWVGAPSHYERFASPARAPWGLDQERGFPLGAPTLRAVQSAESSYTRFAYSYADSAEEARAKEWRNYDAFGGSVGLDNESQPQLGAI